MVNEARKNKEPAPKEEKPVDYYQRGRDLSKDYENHATTKNTNIVAEGYEKLKETLAGDQSNFNDAAVIYMINKMFDPTSIVRETEYSAAEKNQGLWNAAKETWDKYKGTGFLSDEGKDLIRDTADRMMRAQLKVQNEVDNYFEKIAKSGNVDIGNLRLITRGNPLLTQKNSTPNSTIRPLVTQPAAGQPAPQAQQAKSKNFQQWKQEQGVK